ncbi:MAG: 3-deoxy-8-phosphooctulonate synthase [Planctomycetes bacterium]|nr:3-deoxy-8-phosphooctulonate synthase [Planctomycetota bacterium]
MSPPTDILSRFFARPGQPLLVIAGPCVLEDAATNLRIGRTVRDAAASAGLAFMFKASFDKANRSSGRSRRGPGVQEGLAELQSIGRELGVPVTSDVHAPEQCEAAAGALDMLQIPAFLCRQTDLLLAAARTGRPVNVKKGQFMSPAEMRNVVEKLRTGGCPNVMVTERGTTFGYHRLVNDFIGIGDLLDQGSPVCFDITHSTQLPGAEGERTGGRPERAPLLARAAVAAGVHAVFLECHPEPARASSDASTMLPLDQVPALLARLSAIHRAAGA